MQFLQRLNTTLQATLATLVMAVAVGVAAQEAETASEGGARAMAVTVEAVVTDIDLETRHVTLQGPGGDLFTITVPESASRLDEVKVGDRLVATYLAGLEGELREPTEEELAEPWVVVKEAGVADDENHPGVGAARVIRAVCTIEGLNRILGTVVIKDPRGKVHVIGDVEPGKMEGVTLGQTLVVVYAEALALSLEPAEGE
jgi:Cu/Ag efflux protein CusF